MRNRATTSKAKKGEDGSTWKLFFLGGGCFCVLLLLWARAYQVQILLGQDLARRADRQYWASEAVAAERGEIFDRNGKLLAKSIRTKSVYLRPFEISNRSKTIRELSRILGMSSSRVRQLVRSKKKFVWVARKIGDKQASQLVELGLSGVHLKEEGLRLYPQGHLAGQLLGFVGLDGHGLEGIEKSLDHHLSGQVRVHKVLRDAAGKRLYDEALPLSQNGRDLFLTIDSRIQSVSEEVLAGAVERFNGKYGMCLVVEVQSGDILAWAQYPFFNPNAYRTSSPAEWKNRIALDIFEPGSTLKPILVAAALEEGVCRTDSLYFCENGRWEVGRKKVRDTHKYQWLPVNRILRYSSNIGAAKIGLDLGKDRFHAYLDRFGLLQAPELPLPGLSSAMVRPAHAWTRVDLANAAFGQGVGVTTLQLARGFLTLARKGERSGLHLLRDEPGASRRTSRAVSRKNAEAVLGMLEEVVEKDGTGTRARIPGIRVGGKTGTAQKAHQGGGYGDSYVASFVGLLPSRNPQYLVVCVVDEPHPQHYGGVVAAPAVREIGTSILAASGDIPLPGAGKGRAPSPRVQVVESTVPELEDKKSLPDLRGMSVRKAVEVLISQGVLPELMTDGVVVARQDPAPATGLQSLKQTPCRLWLTDKRVH